MSPPPPAPSRTNRTHRVPHPGLIGHAAARLPGEAVETREHEALVQLPEGRHCFEVRATAADAAAILKEIRPPVRRE